MYMCVRSVHDCACCSASVQWLTWSSALMLMYCCVPAICAMPNYVVPWICTCTVVMLCLTLTIVFPSRVWLCARNLMFTLLPIIMCLTCHMLWMILAYINQCLIPSYLCVVIYTALYITLSCILSVVQSLLSVMCTWYEALILTWFVVYFCCVLCPARYIESTSHCMPCKSACQPSMCVCSGEFFYICVCTLPAFDVESYVFCVNIAISWSLCRATADYQRSTCKSS
jgi:hypothetical protein